MRAMRGMAAALAVALMAAPVAAEAITEELHDRAVATLQSALHTETAWVRVHAAEALLLNGLPEGVEAVFLPELETSPAQHRIGVWRVLARAQQDPERREHYVARIRAAFLDLDGPDRLHAAETLGKLGDARRSTALLLAAVANDTPMSAYARLILANAGSVEDTDYLAALLGSYDEKIRDTVGYALRFAPNMAESTLARVREAALTEPEDSSARLNLLIAWLAHASDADRSAIMELLKPYAESSVLSARYQFGEAMVLCGGGGDVPVLRRLLDDEDVDVRVSAANALLAVERR